LATKKKSKKTGGSKKSWVLYTWLLVLSPLIGLLLLTAIAAMGDLPNFKTLETPKSELATEIITSDHEVLGKYYRKNRTNVSYEDLSPYLIEALMATEDERFMEHSGIDLASLVRAVVYMGSKGGGSTLTQQLAKQLMHEPATSIFQRVLQKAQEWVISLKLEKSYTKEEILTMYLNQYDFLNQAVGIQSASKIYFDKKPKELNIQESAMLVGMLKNSALYNPLRRAEMVHDRRNVVLGQMLRNDLIAKAAFDSLKTLPLDLHYVRESHDEGLAPYFREILRSEVTTLLNSKDADGKYLYANPETGTPYDLYSDGLKIYTTIDSRLQEYAEYGVRTHLQDQLQGQFNSYAKNLRSPPFSNDIDTGEIEKILTSAKKRSRMYKVLRGDLCNNCERSKTLEKVRVDGKMVFACTNEECLKSQPIYTETQVDSIFDTPKEMEVFSWKGQLDTLMSPMDSIRYYKRFLQAGMMSMDPKTGFVKAWVGGIDYKEFKYDHVKQGKRQVGSTFKPIIYATAIREGNSPCMEIPKVPTTFQKGTFGLQKDWTPQDSDHDYGFMGTLQWGLANSVNTITAHIMKQFGPDAVIKLARDMGITSDLAPVPSLCLGVADLSVYEITAANAVFANQGVYIEPIIITRIEDKAGNAIYNVMPKTREALDPRTSAIMLEMMKGTIDGAYNRHKGRSSGTAMRLRMNLDSRAYDGFPNDIHIACKTGTTQNQSDGWFIGMTPDLVTGVWVGAEDRSVRFASLQLGMGTNMALPMWGYYMKKAYEDKTLEMSHKDFEHPEGLNIRKELDCTVDHDHSPNIFESDELFD
jgi:penicillin-binding protein 1A